MSVASAGGDALPPVGEPVAELDSLTARAAPFLMKLARALHTYGMPSHRLELALSQVSAELGVAAHYLVTPTSIFASIGSAPSARTFIERLEPGQIDLGKQTELHGLIGAVCRRRLTLEEAAAAVDALVERPPVQGWPAVVASFGLASTGAAVFFGGGRSELIAAGAIGLAIGLLVRAAGGSRRLAMVMPGVAGVAGVLIAAAVQAALGPMFPFIPTLAGLIILIPGLNLTIAVNELAHAQLVSGTARLGGALMAFLQIAFGVALGKKLVGVVAGAQPVVDPAPLTGWMVPLALVVTAVAMTVLFRARPRDLPLILVAAGVSFGGSRLGTEALGPELGVLVGAWLVGTVGHLAGRWLDQPSAIVILPGILLLVPGALGFRSLSALMANDVVSGIQAGFTMLLVAASLVTGLLLASLIARSQEAF